MKDGITINGKEYILINAPNKKYNCADCDLLEKCYILENEKLCGIFPNSEKKYFKIKS